MKAAWMMILTAVLACKPNNGSTQLKDIATSSKVKTGMYTPEKSSDVSTGYQMKASRMLSVADMTRRLGVDLVERDGQELYVVPTFEGDQILVMKQGQARPLPVGGVSAKGETFFLSAPIERVKTGGALVGSFFLRLKSADEPMKGHVSPDGNQTNISLVYKVRNALSQNEDYLVSYLNQLDTLGSKPVRLLKIGNAIVESKSGETVMEFRERGNQVWKVFGIYADSRLKHGSVLWSPDMKTYYSVREKGDSIVQWTKQDDNSMDISNTAANVRMPRIVEELLDEEVTSDVRKLDLTGPIPYSTVSRAFSLVRRPQQAAKSPTLALTMTNDLAPDESAAGYDDFFDPESQVKSLSLSGGRPPRFNGANSYPQGMQVDLGNGLVGTVVSPTSVTTTPAGWFSSEQKVRRTYVQTPSGTIRELTSTNGSATEQRYLNEYDVRNMAAASQAQLNSPAQAQREQEFRNAIAESNERAQDVVNSANKFEQKYATPQGFVTNVVVPVATAGLANNAGTAAREAAGRLENTTEALAETNKKLAELGVNAVGTTTQIIANTIDNGRLDAGAGAGMATDIMGNSIAAGSGSSGAGTATTLASALVSETVNSAQGGFDATDSTISIVGSQLASAANAAMPGAGVAVTVASDGAQVGANYLEAAAADAATERASNDYYEPVKQNQQMNDILANATFPAAPSSGTPAPAQGTQAQAQTPAPAPAPAASLL